MQSPFPAKVSPRGKAEGKSVKDRLGSHQVVSDHQQSRGPRQSRHERGHGPPPDPGYK